MRFGFGGLIWVLCLGVGCCGFVVFDLLGLELVCANFAVLWVSGVGLGVGCCWAFWCLLFLVWTGLLIGLDGYFLWFDLLWLFGLIGGFGLTIGFCGC